MQHQLRGSPTLPGTWGTAKWKVDVENWDDRMLLCPSRLLSLNSHGDGKRRLKNAFSQEWGEMEGGLGPTKS